MKERRCAPLLALAVLALLVVACPRRAEAGVPSIPLPALTVRNGDWLSLGIADFHELHGDLNFVTRVEVGLGGASLGLGVLLDDGFGKHSNAANVSLQGKLLCTYGLTSWPVSAYAGPELAVGAGFLKFTGGVMFDLANAGSLHPQFGVGFGL